MNFALATQMDEIKGYATRANALKAVAKLGTEVQFGADCRVMVAVNVHGRFIPVAYNVKHHHIGALCHAGIVCVN